LRKIRKEEAPPKRGRDHYRKMQSVWGRGKINGLVRKKCYYYLNWNSAWGRVGAMLPLEQKGELKRR